MFPWFCQAYDPVSSLVLEERLGGAWQCGICQVWALSHRGLYAWHAWRQDEDGMGVTVTASLDDVKRCDRAVVDAPGSTRRVDL